MLEKSESVKKLANDYGIGSQTVRDTKKNKEKLIKFTRNCPFNDWCGEWRGMQGKRDTVRRKRRCTSAACIDLDYVEQWDFNYSDIVTLRNICTVFYKTECQCTLKAKQHTSNWLFFIKSEEIKFLVIMFSRPIFLPRTEIVSMELFNFIVLVLKIQQCVSVWYIEFSNTALYTQYVILYGKGFNLQRKEKIILSVFSIIRVHLSSD